MGWCHAVINVNVHFKICIRATKKQDAGTKNYCTINQLQYREKYLQWDYFCRSFSLTRDYVPLHFFYSETLTGSCSCDGVVPCCDFLYLSSIYYQKHQTETQPLNVTLWPLEFHRNLQMCSVNLKRWEIHTEIMMSSSHHQGVLTHNDTVTERQMSVWHSWSECVCVCYLRWGNRW